MLASPTQLVSEQVRTARLARGWSARQLAEASETALNTISLIERGKISPTVATLSKLANALGVSLASLVEEPAGKEIVYLPSDARRRFSGVGVDLENLGSGLPGQTFEALLLTIEPGADSGPEAIVHTGQELVYCLAGRLQYQVGGEVFALAIDDSLLFEAALPHRWRNESAEVARILLLMQSEHGSGRARPKANE